MPTHQLESDSQTAPTPFSAAYIPVIAFASAATVTAAAAGIATYLYLQRKATSTPQHLLSRCRSAIDQLEKSIEAAHA